MNGSLRATRRPTHPLSSIPNQILRMAAVRFDSIRTKSGSGSHRFRFTRNSGSKRFRFKARFSQSRLTQDSRGSVRFDSDPIRFRFAPVPLHTQFQFKTVPVHTGSRVGDLKMVFFGCPCSCLRRVVDLKKVFFGCPKSTQNTGSGSRTIPVHTGSGSQKFWFTRFGLIEKRFGSRPS